MKPELIKFVAGTKAKASEVNENFEKVLNYAETASAVVSFDIETEYKFGQWVLGQVDDEFGLYESLVEENKGHLLSDEAYWKKVSMGGGGLEIGDIGFTQLAIDESLGKRRYLNGSVIIQDQYQVFTEKVKSSVAQNADLACTEEEYQTEVTMTGFCGKYVVDDEAGTIRLPKYPEYKIFGDTIPVVGNGKTLGLQSKTATSSYNGGLLYQSASNMGLTVQSEAFGTEIGTSASQNSKLDSVTLKTFGVTTDPTKTGIVAQLDEAGNKIYGTYFIQVATGASVKENITNEVELNNPFVLLEGHYFTAPVYNSSWLQANEGYTGSLALHPTAYNALLIEQNPNVEVGTTVDNYTKRGLSVKLDTEAYTDYDFVLNTTSQTFRCPLKINKASGRAVAGNGKTLGWESDGIKYGTISDQTYGFRPSQQAYGTQANGINGNVTTAPNAQVMGITTDPTKSGIETSDSDVYLYFYVGETVQNANLINAGRVEEKIADLIPNNSSLISSYSMPNYEAMITGANIPSGTWIQVMKDSFVVTYGGDSYTETYYVYVSPDKTTKYITGHRHDDINSNTQVTSFAFFVPKGWYFQNNAEKASTYHIYPLKGAN